MRRLAWVLNATLLAAAAVVARRAYLVVDGTASPVVGDTSVEETATGEFDLPRLPGDPAAEGYRIIVDKNLFSPQRAPAPPPAAPAEARKAPAGNPADRHAVYGIVSDSPGAYRALIRDKKNATTKARQYGVGDALGDGYTIRRIDDKGVMVADGEGGETLLELRGPKGPEDTAAVNRSTPAMQPPATPVDRVTPQTPGFPVNAAERRAPVPIRTVPPRPASPRSVISDFDPTLGTPPPIDLDAVVEVPGDSPIPELTSPPGTESEYWNAP
jgi:hypothetical protein